MVNLSETMKVAVQHHQAGRLQQAEQFYHLALQNAPNHPAVLHSLAMIAYQTGRYDAALRMVTQALANNSQVPQLHNTRGVVLEALGEFEQAIDAYQHAVRLKPDYAEAYGNMGIALQAQGKFDAAVEKCEKAVSLAPHYAKAYNTMGFSLEKQGKFTQAIESYRHAVRLAPDFAEAYNHLAVLLNAEGRSAEAIENYKRAIQIDPAYAEVYNNLGIVLKDQEQFEEAVAHFERALRLEPKFAEAYYNLANSLRDQGRCGEAVQNYRHAIRLKPDYTEAHWNLSLTLLLDGNFIEGWKGYRRRRNADLKILTDFHRSGKPRWDGSSFVGKTLFVHYEQGLGDNIQFARYLPMVKARGGTVIFETLRPLIGLFREFPGADELVEFSPDKKPSARFDVYTSLLDMPNIFETTMETVPAEVPYLHADPVKIRYWRDRLAGPDFKVGIAWAGSPTHGNDRYRSCRLRDFAPLVQIPGVRLYGLQKGNAAAQMHELAATLPVTNISEEFQDLTDTAAAVENLDLVISVDTCVLHLAGALGKPVWALLPFAPEWRWMLNRPDSPWYPTMKLFRQQKWGRWDTVFLRVAEELRTIVEERKNKSQRFEISSVDAKMIPAIIPAFRNKDQLEKCIAHLKNQTIDVEIFVRDNNSNNVYFTAAVNEGIRRYLDKPCKYILVLNQDMYLQPTAVEIMVAFMDSHPECGIGSPLQLHVDDPHRVIFAGSYEAFPAGRHQHGRLSEYNNDEQIFWANGACMILRTKMVQQIGLLDENLRLIGSDSDYCFTARARGWQVCRIAGARGVHEKGVSGLGYDADIEALKRSDMIYFGRKWLTGQLYKDLAYEGKSWTPERVKHIMAQLEGTTVRLST